MKKLLSILTLTTMLLCTACGDSDTDTANDTSTSSAPQSSAEETPDEKKDESSEKTESEPEEETVDEGSFFNLHGLNMFLPPYFEDANEYARSIYEKELDSGSMVYYDIQTLLDYGRNHGTDTYELEDVPEILKYYITSDMSQHFDIDTASTFVPELDEQVELLGTTFIHQTGTIDVMYCGAPAEPMYYSVYYGLLDMQSDEKVPVSWLCYSDDESTLDELASTVDLVAEKVEWLPTE